MFGHWVGDHGLYDLGLTLGEPSLLEAVDSDGEPAAAGAFEAVLDGVVVALVEVIILAGTGVVFASLEGELNTAAPLSDSITRGAVATSVLMMCCGGARWGL